MRYRTELAGGLAALGLALRIAAVPLPGASDAPIFELWADTASVEGVGRLYGTGGVFPERRLLERDGVRTKVNYPPLLLYEFVAARAMHLPLKALGIVADALLGLLLWAGLRARGAALAVWLNPAVILTGSVLGYVEPMMALPATAAVIAAASGHAALAGMLIAAAVLTKQLAVLIVPAVLMACAGRRRHAVLGAAAVSIAIGAQVAASGGALNMAWSLAAPLRDPFLSGDAANLWWLIGRVSAPVPLDVYRAVGAAATVAAVAWSIAALPRRAPAWAPAAAAAFAVHAYAVLAVSVHEPHLSVAVPLLAVAAAGRRAFWGPFLLVSAIVAINVPRIAGPTAMSLLALGNCAGLAWHARVYARECRASRMPIATSKPLRIA